MSEKIKGKTPPKVQIDALVLRNTRLQNDLENALEELKYAKAQLLEIKQGYAAQVATNIKLDIQAILGINDQDLAKLTQGKTIEDLEAMLNHLVIAHDAGITATDKSKQLFKPIRSVSGAVAGSSGMTVGCLFGKTAEEIRKMGGNF